VPHPLEHSPADRPLSPGEAFEIAEDMRVFSAESRIRLLFALLEEERTVEELATAVAMEPSAVSQQLRVLRQRRFVTPQREGRRIRYRLHDHHIADLLAAVRHHHEHAVRGWDHRASSAVPEAESHTS
jgi:DNA-binding transcriptional ArsR family regulator